MTYVYGSAEGFKALDMLVNGAHAEIAATGKGHVCLTAPAQERAKEIVGRAKLPRKILRDLVRGYVACINKNGSAADNADCCAHERKHIIKSIDVADIRNIFKKAGPSGKNSRRNYRNGSVFCATDLNLPLKRLSAFDNEFIQYSIPLNELITVTFIISHKMRNEKIFYYIIM